ncbi:hypothetical protein [Mycobacterium sp. 1245852.3]|uniref:hypothetical protein n=1 Tax=Mycobacterium sp. 1245852.3 TaxID=1856860 RepID=UPI0007FC4460|nr:hypothetical protein [Mycobacterium sp. 1245852.3]OBJ93993.1 hypothetical protein A9W96_20810 [Mycobacterium sp. 1245852.3]
MSLMPDGWSVDVDGANIVVSFSDGDRDGRWVLSRHDARVLRAQLHLAYLLAGRNRWSTGAEPGATSEEVIPHDWAISAIGDSVEFVVPVSAVDGRYILTHAEALAAGVTLIREAERARHNRMESRRRAIEELASESFAGLYGPDYLEDLRRDWPDDAEDERGGAE